MRIPSTGTKFYVDSGVAGAPTNVIAVSKAKPAVATLADAGDLAQGDVLQFAETGWPTLDNRPYQLSLVAANNVTLVDSDTSGVTANLGANAKATPVEFGEACLATLTFNSPAGSEIDTTTLCDEARVTVSGMPGVSTWQATGFWDANDAVQQRLRELYRTGEKVPFKVVFADGSGLLFRANVNTYNVTAGVDQAVAITVGGTMSGVIGLLMPEGATPASFVAPQPAAQPVAA